MTLTKASTDVASTALESEFQSLMALRAKGTASVLRSGGDEAQLLTLSGCGAGGVGGGGGTTFFGLDDGALD